LITPSVGISIWYGTVKGVVGSEQRISDFIRILIEQGYNLYEVSLDYPWPFSERELLEALLRALAENGGLIALHAPWRDLALASPMEDVRRTSVDVMTKNLDLVVGRHDVKYIVVHLHSQTSMGKVLTKANWDKVVESAAKSLYELSEWSKSSGVPICVENMPRGASSYLEFLSQLSNSIRCLALDIGHFYTSYIDLYEERYSDYYSALTHVLSTFNEKAKVVHLHDVIVVNSKPFKDIVDHVVPGQGVLDYRRVLKIVSGFKVEHVIVEAFIASDGRHIKLSDLPNYLREYTTWVKVYL